MDVNSLIKEYGNASLKLEKAIHALSEELMQYIPFEGAWSIHEHIIHLVESDINNFIRWRSIIGQPGSEVFVIRDEDDWARKIGYSSESREDYLDVFRLLRAMGSRYLAGLTPPQWTRDSFIYKYQGREKNMNLLEAIELYTGHTDEHIRYIERNIKWWRNAHE